MMLPADPLINPLTAVTISLLMFVLGMAYAAGRHISRIDHLELWRHEFRLEIKGEMEALHQHLQRIETLIQDGNSTQ